MFPRQKRLTIPTEDHPLDGEIVPLKKIPPVFPEWTDEDRLRHPRYPWLRRSGSRGVHVVVPLDGKADFETVRRFATDVVSILASRFPDRLTVEQRKDKRKGRLYMDVLRNSYGQTGVAPYSVRPVEEVAVAAPLDWDEFSRLQDGARKYTVNNISHRLGQKGDPWRKIRLHARSLKEPWHRLECMQKE